MAITRHSRDRAIARVHRATGGRSSVIMFQAEAYAKRNAVSESAAVRVAVLPEVVTFADDPSNGDTVWAVCRDGKVVTLMLRRESQYTAPADFSVDKVDYLA